eukprot:6074794-Pyramimonas_sp.AAC.1
MSLLVPTRAAVRPLVDVATVLKSPLAVLGFARFADFFEISVAKALVHRRQEVLTAITLLAVWGRPLGGGPHEVLGEKLGDHGQYIRSQ